MRTTQNIKIPSVLAIALSGALVSCGSDDSDTNQELSYDQLSTLTTDGGKLTKGSAAQTELTIKNGIFLSTSNLGNYSGCVECSVDTDLAVETSTDAAADTSSGPDSDDSSFSSTTTQETGVAESDRVKYDGDHLFLASNNYGYYTSDDDSTAPNTPFVRVLQRQNDDSLIEQSIITTDTSASHLSDLYLNDDRIMTIYNSYTAVSDQASSSTQSTDAVTSEFYWYGHNSFGVNIVDVSDTSAPSELVKYSIEGYIQNSRRIENKVYIVSQFSPQLSFNYPQETSDDAIQQIYQDIVDLDTLDVLPKMRINGGELQLLVQPEQCYLPENAEDIHGYTQVTTITTFDLSSPTNFESICVVAPLSGLYASSEHLYLYGSVYDQETEKTNTVIHQFDYNDDSVDYKASGEIEGHVSWHNSHMRFSEKNEYLRVLTSQSTWTESGAVRDHQLFVLQADNNQNLTQVAKLPNDEYPAAIGKPDEDIYAVRYFSDKAYVVTFRRTDPLYVIDLSDPASPFISGELEIPGYSSYLQPLSEHYVLGIGQQVDPNNEITAEDVAQTQDTFVEGAKAELYNVSDPANPTVAATLVYDSKYSVAEWDYHALTQLKVSDTEFKFAFPLSGWSQTPDDNGGYTWHYHQSLQLVDVNLDNGGSLSNVGNLSPDTNHYGNWGDRSVLHGDIIYYIRHNSVWQSYWSDPSVLNGEY